MGRSSSTCGFVPLGDVVQGIIERLRTQQTKRLEVADFFRARTANEHVVPIDDSPMGSRYCETEK